MTPARKLILPLLISLLLISFLFAAKQALAIWIFDFDPPTLCVTFSDTSLNQNCPTPQTTGVFPYLDDQKIPITLTDGSTTATFECDDGTSSWSSGCKSLTYKILYYKRGMQDNVLDETITGTCNNDDPNDPCDLARDPDQTKPLAQRKIVIQVPIVPKQNHLEVRVQPETLDKAGNKKSLDYRFNNYPYKIQGYVWIDTNQNAIKNAGEDCYVGNPTISLSGDITAPDQTYSSDTGCLNTYSFSVPAGTFYVALKDSSVPTYDLTCKTMKGGCANQQSWQQTVIVTNANSWAQWGITDAKVWWQTKLGDVRAGNGTITDTIPASCKGQCKPYLSLNSDGMHGIVFYTGSPPNFGGGSASESPPSAWLVNNSFSGTLYSYDWIDGQTSQKLPFTGAQPVTSGVYKNSTDPTVTISSAWSVSPNLKIVVLVNGNLNINQTINFNPERATGGFLAFYVKGNINVDPNVSAANNRDNPQLEGIYVADGYFNLGGGNRRLNIEGSVIAKQGLLNMRNLLGGNNTNPSFYVFYRPDFLLSAPPVIQQSSFVWQEIAP